MRKPKLDYVKPYSQAVRDLLGVPWSTIPPGWDPNLKNWTAAQQLAERDMSRALAGDPDAVDRVIDRAEGRPASAPEDRATRNAEAEANTLAGLALLARLQSVITGKVIESEVELEQLMEGDSGEPD